MNPDASLSRRKRVFVSASFSEPDVSGFVTALLAELNLQERLSAVVYRGVEEAIRDHDTTMDRNAADIRAADLAIAIASDRYTRSPYCLHEADVIAQEAARRALPALLVRWPSITADAAQWPAPMRALRAAAQSAEVEAIPDPTTWQDQTRSLMRDAATRLGVEPHDNAADPGQVRVVARTEIAALMFPPADRSMFDGALVSLLCELREHEKHAAAWLAAGRAQALRQELSALAAETARTMSPGAASVLALAQAAYAVNETRGAADRRAIAAEARAAASAALHTGDVYVARDACILLGNLEAEGGGLEEALAWHLQASRIERVLQEENPPRATPFAALKPRLEAQPPEAGYAPIGPSAYVLFDNIFKLMVRIGRPVSRDDVRARARAWRTRIDYADPSHHERYGTLLAFALAWCGDCDLASETLALVAVPHMETLEGLARRIAARAGTRSAADARAVGWLKDRLPALAAARDEEIGALCLDLAALLAGREALDALDVGVLRCPGSVELRLKRALAGLGLGKLLVARDDLDAAAASNRDDPAARAPYCRSGQDIAYMQGAAHWILGADVEAAALFAMSGRGEHERYAHTLAGARARLAPP